MIVQPFDTPDHLKLWKQRKITLPVCHVLGAKPLPLSMTCAWKSSKRVEFEPNRRITLYMLYLRNVFQGDDNLLGSTFSDS